MTNKELINELSKYPADSKIDFQLFSNLTIRRGDVVDSDIMIRKCYANNHICIQINLPVWWENSFNLER